MRSYEVFQAGKRFVTVCRNDGFWAIEWLSKNKRLAHKKGREFVEGKRTSTRKYTTPLGRAENERKSLKPRRVGVIAHHSRTPASLALLAALIDSKEPTDG